jgi:hypothetical protein
VLLGLAFFIVGPTAWVAFRSFGGDVFPQCRGSLARVDGPVPTPPDETLLDATGSPHRGGYSLHVVDDAPDSLGHHALRVTRTETDAAGAELECGSLPLSWPGGDRAYLAIYEDPESGVFRVRERYATGRYTFVNFRATSTPARHLQLLRLSPRHLPALIAFVALASLALAFVRSRRGMAYTAGLHAWREGELGEGGRVVTPNGAILGVVESRRSLVTGSAVLVAPDREQPGPYRDLRVLRRAEVVSGSHARWREWTTRGLSDARSLAIISAACSACALVGRWLGA